ncbi:MAG: Lycopene cyclase [Anaerolineae bacterium]|nr:Lycopene cyclase [Anaerolineae bacterium]
MSHYDFILAGGGSAGLNLAHALLRSPLRDRSLLIVDQDAKDTNDRTWCSWFTGPHPFEPLLHASWDRIRFSGGGYDAVLPLAPYRYAMLRGIDFYNYSRETFAASPHVTWLQGHIESVGDGNVGAQVTVDGRTFTADWAFDSRWDLHDYTSTTAVAAAGLCSARVGRYHYLQQHFLGWEIVVKTPCFDSQTATLFDLRTPQRDDTGWDGMRFMYILPFSERSALVEFTLFSARLLSQADYEAALRDYIRDVLGVGEFCITAKENGVIPMTDQPFPRRASRYVMRTGTRGGRVKASSGFAFFRTVQDSHAIARSLIAHGHPFDIPVPPRRYRLFDSMLLQILYRRGDLAERVFADLFSKNPLDRLLRFLDEEGSLWENLRLMATVPPLPFMSAWLRLKLFNRI